MCSFELHFPFSSSLVCSLRCFHGTFLGAWYNSADIPAVCVIVVATGITALLSLDLVVSLSLPVPSRAAGNDVIAGWTLVLWTPGVLQLSLRNSVVLDTLSHCT